MGLFKLITKLRPKGDQPQAIRKLTEGVLSNTRYQTLLGVTGSGKTFTMANIIKDTGKPTLVISHNKTLAAQLYAEFREFFPENAVHYFVSYYDYYQPEAYIPQRDIYIEKDASINENLDRLRLAATSSLLSRQDVIIVASVSCIYGLGSPEDYAGMVLSVKTSEEVTRESILKRLVDILYERNEIGFGRGNFRVRGDVIEVWPAYEEFTIRLVMDSNCTKTAQLKPSPLPAPPQAGDGGGKGGGDLPPSPNPSHSRQGGIGKQPDPASAGQGRGIVPRRISTESIKAIYQTEPLTGEVKQELKSATIFPAKHFVMPEDKIHRAIGAIKEELHSRLEELKRANKLIEAQRLSARTNYDMEMLQEVGYCKGIENYSRHLSGRLPGQRPYTLIDYFPKDFLVFVDESHATVPQINGMYHGDRSRKEVLVEYGFRLPSALDNRPMRFDEWEKAVNQLVFVSATPGPYELSKSNGQVVEQIIRPTGLVDPAIKVQPTQGQVDDLFRRIIDRVKKKERILVTTLTKRLAEDLSGYLVEKGVKGRYLHSEIDTIERSRILRELREGKFDVLVGVNLLREGLDLPEVSLVAILDADKEGFLRSETSLIQTVGRTARNVNGEVILYADEMTGSMKRAIKETERRRILQLEFNKAHKITPRTIKKAIIKGIEEIEEGERIEARSFGARDYTDLEKAEFIKKLTEEMHEAAQKQEFEKAAELRDLINQLKNGRTEKRKNREQPFRSLVL